MKWLLDLLSGNIVKQFTDPLLQAYQAKLNATNDKDKLEAEKVISRIEAARDIAVVEAGRAWSATSIGRWLIVVPFGIWWMAIFAVQIINPTFGLNFVVIDVPSHIYEMAKILVPAIVIADSSALIAGNFKK